MPSRNVLKIDTPNSYYHVYARGHAKRKIFRENSDFDKFLELFSRHLSDEQSINITGRPYAHLKDDLSLNTYCLMGNHFHLLLHQTTQGAMSTFMRGIMTSYSMYFNRKYKSSGALFESRYKASRVSSNEYLMHISRYIHLNPKDWMGYPHSSIHAYYLGAPEWLTPKPIIELFGTLPKYADFLKDYSDYKKSMKLIEDQLANRISKK